mmetsp:Transcript_18525/g.43944  ORF Transcript_18525/g.43944 Transcript_18525/m.43944 type:complete len:228 (+) Transcript_18525:209-892(+)
MSSAPPRGGDARLLQLTEDGGKHLLRGAVAGHPLCRHVGAQLARGEGVEHGGEGPEQLVLATHAEGEEEVALPLQRPLLVVGLRVPEVGRHLELRVAIGPHVERLECRGALLGAVHKDDALVLPRLAAPLGIVRAEEGVEHVRVRQLRLVKLKLDRLGVLGIPVGPGCCLARVKTVLVAAGAHLAVRGIGRLATAVAHACAVHPGQRRQRCLGVPESAERERCGLKT